MSNERNLLFVLRNKVGEAGLDGRQNDMHNIFIIRCGTNMRLLCAASKKGGGGMAIRRPPYSAVGDGRWGLSYGWQCHPKWFIVAVHQLQLKRSRIQTQAGQYNDEKERDARERAADAAKGGGGTESGSRVVVVVMMIHEHENGYNKTCTAEIHCIINYIITFKLANKCSNSFRLSSSILTIVLVSLQENSSPHHIRSNGILQSNTISGNLGRRGVLFH